MSGIKYFVALFLSVTYGVLTANGHIQFDHFGTTTGFTNNSVRWISQDHKGFMWFGTLNGLNRFDGHKVKSYPLFDKTSTTSLNNRIIQIHQDKNKRLWVITYDKKMHVLDLTTEKATSFPYFLYPYEANYQVVNPASYITETSSGCMWLLSADNGCIRVRNKLDGFICDTFNYNGLLQKRAINFVHQDKNGGVWLGSNKGLTFLPNDTTDFKSKQLTHYFYGACKWVTSYLEFNNEIWFGTARHGILKYNLVSNQFITSKPFLADSGIISAMGTNANHQILIGTVNDGLYYIEKETPYIRHYTSANDKKFTKQIKQIYSSNTGQFWIATSLRGVTMFDPKTSEFNYFPLNPQFRENIKQPDKIIIFEDSNGTIWVGNYGGGLFRFNRKKGQFEHFYARDANPASLSSNYVLSMFEDACKYLRIGKRKGGVNRVSLRTKPVTIIKPEPQSELKYRNDVRAIWCDSNQNVWTATKGGLIQCYDANKHCIWDSRQNTAISQTVTGAIYGLYGDNNGNLWVGTKGAGIYILEGILDSPNKIPSKITSLQSVNRTTQGISNNNVYAIRQDNRGQYWTAHYFGGLNLIRHPFSKPEFTHFWAGTDTLNTISDDRVRCIFFDSANNLWVGTVNGLNFLPANALTATNKRFFKIKLNDHNLSQAVSNDILTITENSDGHIIVGTFGSGLFELLDMELNKGLFRWQQYTTDNGLGGNVILGVTCDKRSNTWLTTDVGITKLNSSDSTILNFQRHNIIGYNQVFSENSCHISGANNLICGASGGFVYLNLDSLARKRTRYALSITDFRIFDEEIRPNTSSIIDTTIGEKKLVTLPYNQNYFTIAFATPGLYETEEARYMYKLEHYEERWNTHPNTNSATYKNVPPGKYLFRVKSANGSKINHHNEAVLTIVINPPIWKTTQAYGLYFIALTLVTTTIFRLITSRLELKQSILVEKKLSEDKIRFYTNISHELKTPLSLILAPAEILANTTNTANSHIHNANLIKQNAIRLLVLIEQMLDFRKIQKEGYRLKVAKHDIIHFCQTIFNRFIPLAEEQNIIFEYMHDKSQYMCWFDADFLEKIVTNLLSNALKHTPAGNSVQFIVEISTEGICCFSVLDEGHGIKPDHVANVFDRFSTFATSQAMGFGSSGIGLAIVKELVDLHKGNISVQSAYGRGSLFTVNIPVDKSYYKKCDRAAVSHPASPLSNHYHRLLPSVTTEVMPAQSPVTGDPKPLLLIIEDNQALSSFIAQNLASHYTISTAENGRKGMELIKSEMPQMVICDVMLPEMNGIEITTQVKSNFDTCHIPVVLLTACASEKQKLDGIINGADDYITKPFSIIYLQKRLHNILHQRKLLTQGMRNAPHLKPEINYASQQDKAFVDTVVKLTEQMMSNLNFSIDMIIKEMRLGRTMFYKKMKDITGYSPREFIMTIRMKKAAQMLRETNYTIKAIGEDIGYNNTEQFSKNFKNNFNMLPSEYRKTQNNNTLQNTT